MRKINKSGIIPLTLQNAPVPNAPDQVKESIYKAEDVRKQLLEDQFYKCAYCESRITREYNDVEHYRPKSIYYWLGLGDSAEHLNNKQANRNLKNNQYNQEEYI